MRSRILHYYFLVLVKVFQNNHRKNKSLNDTQSFMTKPTENLFQRYLPKKNITYNFRERQSRRTQFVATEDVEYHFNYPYTCTLNWLKNNPIIYDCLIKLKQLPREDNSVSNS